MKISKIALLCLSTLLLLAACAAPTDEAAQLPTATFAIPKNEVEILPPVEEFGMVDEQSLQGGRQEEGLQIHETPVLETGLGMTWNRKLVSMTVFYFNGNFYMAYSAADDWRSSFQVGAASSDDGFEWETPAADPRLSPEAVPGGAYSVFASTLLVGDDSGRLAEWDLYYSTNESDTQFPRGAIGRAVAVDPLVPWTPDETLALIPGETGEWDDHVLAEPEVLKTSDGYIMYYTGVNHERNIAIGMAASMDGVAWRKYDNPETTAAPYLNSDPILSSDSPGWEAINIRSVRVLQLSQNNWIMAFLGSFDQGRHGGIGYATSSDGIHWTPAEENPVITIDSIPDGVSLLDIDLVASEDTIYLFLACTRIDESSGVYVATRPR